MKHLDCLRILPCATAGHHADTSPAGGGWVQVDVDADRAGSGLLNLAVDDLAATRDELATRGVETARSGPSTPGVELSPTSDLDGNAITLIGNFRVTC